MAIRTPASTRRRRPPRTARATPARSPARARSPPRPSPAAPPEATYAYPTAADTPPPRPARAGGATPAPGPARARPPAPPKPCGSTDRDGDGIFDGCDTSDGAQAPTPFRTVNATVVSGE